MAASMSPSVAIVYDWATAEFGGAEQVLLALHRAFPQAPLCTSVKTAASDTWTKDWQVRTSFLQKLPQRWRHQRYLAPVLPLAFEMFDVSEYDVIISISSGPAKAVLTKPNQLHISYVLTPPRYLYTHQTRYTDQIPGGSVWRPMLSPLMKWLIRLDQASSWRPDILIPISERVAERTEYLYQRKLSSVMYPPVELPTQAVSVTSQTADHRPRFLCVSRLVEYKRLDLAIQACLELGYGLDMVGTGPAESKLRAMAHNPKT